MFISPLKAIEEGWVTHKNYTCYKDWEVNNHISPNAIDFTLDRMFTINPLVGFIIAVDPDTGKEKKQMRGGDEMYPQSYSGTFDLAPHSSYDVLSDVYVKLPEGVAAMTIIRSSFCRNGLFLTSGLYDSGFEGHVGCVLHNMVAESHIQPGIRVGQIMFMKAEAAGLYSGGYNHGQGTVAIHQAH